jgi:hypothetical protein
VIQEDAQDRAVGRAHGLQHPDVPRLLHHGHHQRSDDVQRCDERGTTRGVSIEGQ